MRAPEIQNDPELWPAPTSPPSEGNYAQDPPVPSHTRVTPRELAELMTGHIPKTHLTTLPDIQAPARETMLAFISYLALDAQGPLSETHVGEPVTGECTGSNPSTPGRRWVRDESAEAPEPINGWVRHWLLSHPNPNPTHSILSSPSKGRLQTDRTSPGHREQGALT